MTNIQIFRNEQFGEIRTLNLDGEAWAVGKDIAEILGYENGIRDVNRHVDEEDRQVINESGLYSLILRSHLPKAKEFKRWVTSEVLPSIRKNGIYGTKADLNLLKARLQTAKEYKTLARLTKDNYNRESLIVKAANTIAGEKFLNIPMSLAILQDSLTVEQAEKIKNFVKYWFDEYKSHFSDGGKPPAEFPEYGFYQTDNTPCIYPIEKFVSDAKLAGFDNFQAFLKQLAKLGLIMTVKRSDNGATRYKPHAHYKGSRVCPIKLNPFIFKKEDNNKNAIAIKVEN